MPSLATNASDASAFSLLLETMIGEFVASCLAETRMCDQLIQFHIPGKFEWIGQGRSAWCKKAELSGPLIQRHQGGSPWNLCITSDWMFTSGRSATA